MRRGLQLIALVLLLTIPASGAQTYNGISDTGACTIGAADHNGVLSTGTGSTLTFTLSVTSTTGSHDDAYVWTTTGHPNSTIWNGTYTAHDSIATICLHFNVTVDLKRYNSSCVLQETVGAGDAACGVDTGAKTISLGSINWAGPVQQTDILAMHFIMTNDGSPTSDTTTFQVTDLASPITEGATCPGAPLAVDQMCMKNGPCQCIPIPVPRLP